MKGFVHLHVHTQFSLLDGASRISSLMEKAKNMGMKAIAITDHGNVFGTKQFHEYAKKSGIKPILGCEMYVAKRSHLLKSADKEDRSGDHLIVLAKNYKGYKNLIKLVSKSWIDGFYYKPRIDKELLFAHSEGLIVSSACLGGELAQAIRYEGLDRAVEVITMYKNVFGEDYYLELMDHGLPEQKQVNEALLELSKRTGVKLIATNDVHFVNADDANAHDILVCLSTSKDLDDPNRLRYSGQEYFKSPEEMAKLFPYAIEALENTLEVADKVEEYKLDRDVLLPSFALPDGFTTQDDYLRHLTYEGAKTRYPGLPEAIRQRLDYELSIVKKMGFAGYFLIVQDFIAAARNMKVAVGPGRGSAAGSAVAYCVGITNIDPVKYKLLFERFLNPERVSMPDVDIDFDEDGRESVMEWVVAKYGKERVAQIITFGSMAAKMAIRDVGRVLKLPLSDADHLSKLVPEKPGTTLKQSYEQVPELQEAQKKGDDLTRKTLKFAETLEGSVRQTGMHACGVIIGPEDLIEHIPLSTNKDSPLLVTQYDGKYIEKVGMLKMDFLGLKTLSIIKDAIENVQLRHGIEIDIDKIPHDDPKTFELYQRGDTVGTFQFESDGMRKYLRELKPTNIEDLIAMNALYRPGPLDFIPLFIKRKHGIEKIEYPHPMLEEILKDTYGIMVYQEQIMQTAQVMASYTLGGADLLRRAMGKKQMDVMEQQKSIFIEGAKKNGVAEETAIKVFDIMIEFANYGFNRSHAAAYSVVAFQTAYMKANYPAEYMAAVLSRNLSDIKKINTFMEESRRMGLKVLGPDVNESYLKFTVNQSGAVRFGMAAIKGVGEGAVLAIVDERTKNGPFKDIFDFVERVNHSSVNKRSMEALVMAGALDSLGIPNRSQYFEKSDDNMPFLEVLMKYGSKMQLEKNSNQNSLFGGGSAAVVKRPTIPKCEEWTILEKLNKEKELIGIYLSSHPLDNFKFEISRYTNTTLTELQDIKALNGREIKIAGMVTKVEERTTKTGNPYGTLTIEDYTDSYRITMFSNDYLKFKNFFTVGYSLFITGKSAPRFGSTSGELEFKVNDIRMLADLKEQMVKSIALKIQLDKITPTLISDLEHITQKYKGNTVLKFLIYDTTDKMWVQMHSSTHKVNVSGELIDLLASNSAIEEYKIE